MDEKFLLKLSFACSVAGLFFLFIASRFIEAEEVAISGLDSTKSNDVVVNGRISSVKDFGSFALVEIAEVKTASIVVFDKRMLKAGVGDNVSISGELQNYKGRREIIADSIKKLQ